jgi:hypothetical protein
MDRELHLNRQVSVTVDDLRQLWPMLSREEVDYVRQDTEDDQKDGALANLGVSIGRVLKTNSRELGSILKEYVVAIESPTWDGYSAEQISGIHEFLSEMFGFADEKTEQVWNLQHPEG